MFQYKKFYIPVVFTIFILLECSPPKRCWSSTYDDRRSEEEFNKFRARCSSWSGSMENGLVLNACGADGINCCCTPVSPPIYEGIRDISKCGEIYLKDNAKWLPEPYSQNAKCACSTLPAADPQAACIRQFLMERLNKNYSEEFKQKMENLKTVNKEKILPDADYYQAVTNEFVPKIYDDHVEAYKKCGCNGTPAFYASWVGVSTVDMNSCGAIGVAVRMFGSCQNGYW